MTAIVMNAAFAEKQLNGQEEDLLRSFLAVGMELAGPVGKPARALLLGESDQLFPGTSGDWPALRMLFRVADDFARRALSSWEQARTSATVLAAVHRLDENLRAGLAVRRDEFFASTSSGRSAADEFAEAVLIVAQREHEEAKLPFLGNLLARVPFRDGIDRAQVNSLVRLAAGLSYRQYGLLAVFSHTERFGLRSTDFNGSARVPFASVAVLQDLFELVRMSLVFQTTGEPITIRDLTPGKLAVGGMGSSLFKLMQLDRTDPDELDALAALLA